MMIDTFMRRPTWVVGLNPFGPSGVWMDAPQPLPFSKGYLGGLKCTKSMILSIAQPTWLPDLAKFNQHQFQTSQNGALKVITSSILTTLGNTSSLPPHPSHYFQTEQHLDKYIHTLNGSHYRNLFQYIPPCNLWRAPQKSYLLCLLRYGGGSNGHWRSAGSLPSHN